MKFINKFKFFKKDEPADITTEERQTVLDILRLLADDLGLHEENNPMEMSFMPPDTQVRFTKYTKEEKGERVFIREMLPEDYRKPFCIDFIAKPTNIIIVDNFNDEYPMDVINKIERMRKRITKMCPKLKVNRTDKHYYMSTKITRR